MHDAVCRQDHSNKTAKRLIGRGSSTVLKSRKTRIYCVYTPLSYSCRKLVKNFRVMIHINMRVSNRLNSSRVRQ